MQIDNDNFFDFSGENAVEIKNMNLWYGSMHAIKNVGLDIPKNKVTAFIGPSGCGKSTVLKSINRMNDLVEGCKITGEIVVGKRDIYERNIDLPTLRKEIGMVFQKPNPFPSVFYFVDES